MAPSRLWLVFCVLLVVQYHSVQCQRRRSGSRGQSRQMLAHLVNTASSCLRSLSVTCPQGIPPQFRPIDGSCHKADRSLGMSNTPYSRIRNPEYADGVHAPRAGATRAPLPSPREVVNRLHFDKDVVSPVVNHFFMNWGQLVAHDITLTHSEFPEANSQCCSEAARGATSTCARINIPNNDPFYRHFRVSCLGFTRSASSQCEQRYREQTNTVTHYMDASFVYGSDADTAQALRSSKNGLLRFRTINGEEHLPLDDDNELFAGDGRVTVTAMLSATQTVFVREHNRVARILARVNPHWSDERLYQEARRVVIAEWQLITYRDWLQWLIGAEAVDSNDLRPAVSGYSQAYNAEVDPRTANDFAASAFRSFHSLIQNNMWIGRNGRQAVSLVDTAADVVLRSGVLQGVIEGMLYQPSQEQDQFMAHQIRNRMFNEGGSFGGDLISADIMRGRDHGLPSYNAYRKTCGLPRVKSWSEYSDLISEQNIKILKSLYASPEDVDYYVGGLVERRDNTSTRATITSPVFQCIVVDQFWRWKAGDPYFFDLEGPAQPFTPEQLTEIRKQTASKIMCDNIRGLKTVPEDAFLMIGVEGNSDVRCDALPSMDFSAWKEDAPIQMQRMTTQSRQSSNARRNWRG